MMAHSQTESTWEINNYGKYINQFPPNTIKINTAIWKDQQENMQTENVYYVQWNLCIYIYIYIYIERERERERGKIDFFLLLCLVCLMKSQY